MDPIVAAVRRVLARHAMIRRDQSVLAAVSGGADSVALLAILVELGHASTAAHFNHGWRGEESERDEAFVRDLCDRLGVTLAVGRAEPPRPATGLEAAGRRARYAFLHSAAAAHGCERIATGHTRDDQAETVLLRLLRGSGLDGLGGILPVRRDGVVRPLLALGRSELRDYLRRRGLAFVEDSTNADPRFARNRLRLDVLPRLEAIRPGAGRRIARLAAVARGRAGRDELLAAEIARRCAVDDDGLSVAGLAEWPLDVRRLAVRAWLGRVRGSVSDLGAVHIEAVAGCTRSGAIICLPGRGVVANEHGALRFDRASAIAPADPAWLHPGETISFAGRWSVSLSSATPIGEGGALPADRWQAVVDADQVEPPFVVRAWRFGDRVRPLGGAGERKLSDVFIDAKVGRRRRSCLPVVEAGGRVLWVAGVVRGNAAAVDASTRRVLRLRATPTPATPSPPAGLDSSG